MALAVVVVVVVVVVVKVVVVVVVVVKWLLKGAKAVLSQGGGYSAGTAIAVPAGAAPIFSIPSRDFDVFPEAHPGASRLPGCSFEEHRRACC